MLLTYMKNPSFLIVSSQVRHQTNCRSYLSLGVIRLGTYACTILMHIINLTRVMHSTL